MKDIHTAVQALKGALVFLGLMVGASRSQPAAPDATASKGASEAHGPARSKATPESRGLRATLEEPNTIAQEPQSTAQGKAERRAAAAILAYGGWVRVVRSDGRSVRLRPDEPLPEFEHVTNLVLMRKHGCKPEALQQLPNCPHLRVLFVDDLPFGDNECQLLADPGRELRHLEFLSLYGTSVRDAGCRQLKRLLALEDLRLGDTDVGDGGCAELKELTNLKRLDLSVTDVGDSGAANLAELKGLVNLNLSCTKVGDAGAAQLAELKRLVKLNLNSTKVGDAGAEALKSLSKLEILELAYTELTDKGLKHLAEMKGLKELYLGELEGITDQGIANLKPLADQLDYLWISGPSITDRGRVQLKKFKYWKLEQARWEKLRKKAKSEGPVGAGGIFRP